MAAAGAAVNNSHKKVLFKICAPSTVCITKINNKQVDNAQKYHAVMPLYSLIDYSDVYLKRSGSLWQYYRDGPVLDNNGKIIDFPANSNNSGSFKFKQQITGQTGNGGTKDVEIMVLLKYLSNFCRTLKMPLINGQISLQLKWSKNCILVADTVPNQNSIFQTNDTTLYVAVVTLSTQENIKLLK